MANLKTWKFRTLALLWITYGSIYLIRVNFSVAIPGMMEEFSWSRTQLGAMATAFLWTYAAGHFVNGQLGDRFSARKMLSLGFILAAAICAIFSLGWPLIVMTILWAANGWAQSMGWGPVIKTLSRWFPPAERGRVGGILGTSYILGGGISTVLAGFIIVRYGWQAGFWIPAIFVAFIALNWYCRLKERPEDAGCLPEQFDTDTPPYQGIAYTLKNSFGDRRVWIMGGGLFFVNLVRYGFLTWAPAIFFETQNAPIDKAAYSVILFPIAGAVGALTTGWLSDKVFGGRRAPLASLFLAATAVLIVAFQFALGTSWLLSIALMAGVGYAICGANVMLIVSAPMDLGGRKAASSVTGMIDGLGYIGAGVQGVVTGVLVDAYGWNAGLAFWIASAIVGSLLVATLWRKT